MTRRLTNLAGMGSLLFAGLAAASLVGKIVFENAWRPLACGDGRSLVVETLLFAALSVSGLASLLGTWALVGSSERKGSIAVAVATAVAVAALILIPNALGGYECMVSTP